MKRSRVAILARPRDSFHARSFGVGPTGEGSPVRRALLTGAALLSTFKLSTIPAHLAEGDEALPAFVPQHQAHTPEALKQGQPADAVEARMVVQRERQSVVGDTAAQMMDVVNADVGGEPAQDARQSIM